MSLTALLVVGCVFVGQSGASWLPVLPARVASGIATNTEELPTAAPEDVGMSSERLA